MEISDWSTINIDMTQTSAHQPNIETLLSRGVEQVLPDTTSLTKLMTQRPIRLYLGIDPTGSELTLGHAVVLRKLQQFALAGHQVILLIGNGTVKIGDPTGRDSTRPMLTEEVIDQNWQNWRKQASKVLDFDLIQVKKNGDWLDQLTYVDIVKLLGQTTVQQLLERDMFQARMKNGLPIFGHEIIYPLLQGYDSVVMDVDLEIGGNDQLFNMMMGRQLLQTMKQKDKWVLTTPIINGTDGRKMSKSYNNYIALTENPIDMYGKLMRVADSEIVTYFTVLTDLELAEVESIKQAMASGQNPMQFKHQLAHTITTWLHDNHSADQARDHFKSAVQDKSVPTDAPMIEFDQSELKVADVLRACLPQESTNNLRRLLDQGAIELFPSGAKPGQMSDLIDLKTESGIRIGKLSFFRLERRSI